MPVATYLTGKCFACKRVFRWETESRVRVMDAVCLGCNGTLIRTRTRRSSMASVEQVDAEWVRGPDKPAVDPDDPSTWP